MKEKNKKTISLFSYISSQDEVDLNLKIIKHCTSVFEFDEIIIVSKILNLKKSRFEKLGAVIIEDEYDLDESYESYNFFKVNRLCKYINTDFVLTVENDGFIIDSSFWKEEFLEYDYIGAPWLNSTYNNSFRVGNGGFSLRSRKMLRATKVLSDFICSPSEVGNEDIFICHENKVTLEKFFKIKFAPVELAAKFAIELNQCPEQKHIDMNDLSTYDTFGFHGKGHLPLMESKLLRNKNKIIDWFKFWI